MGVDWQSPTEVQKDFQVFLAFGYCHMGMWFWEYLMTINIEYELLKGTRPFRLPMIPYLLARYFVCGSYIFGNILYHSERAVNCNAHLIMLQLCSGYATCAASALLMMRTSAIWHQDTYINIFLIVLNLGQIVTWSHSTMCAQTIWVDGEGCIVTKVERWFSANYVLTMMVDGIVLTLSAGRLLWTRRGMGIGGLNSLLITDGMIYFIVTFLINLLQAVFALLELNTPMMFIMAWGAATISAMAACRALRHLADFFRKEESAKGSARGYVFSQNWSNRKGAHGRGPSAGGLRSDVGVPMEDLEQAEYARQIDSASAQTMVVFPELQYGLAEQREQCNTTRSMV